MDIGSRDEKSHEFVVKQQSRDLAREGRSERATEGEIRDEIGISPDVQERAVFTTKQERNAKATRLYGKGRRSDPLSIERCVKNASLRDWEDKRRVGAREQTRRGQVTPNGGASTMEVRFHMGRTAY
ncbi:hypothetical protein C8R45DRAFT_929832 [Mycena sanguinolenta]|nr:hypothetical protein C8R45DRAFT_929832 [Mycena sanguinolenta]